MPHLFDTFTLRGVTLRNRVGVSPMCEYSSEDGFMNDWHLVHLGSRAVGGAGLVMTEATAVEARGRISPQDAGIWLDAHVEVLARIVKFVKAHGATPGIQLAHAGRKASTAAPWLGRGGIPDSAGGWEPIGPSAIPFSAEYRMPREMTAEEIRDVQQAFVAGSKRALEAGFEWFELHGAHGYLSHQFLSPLSNFRTDHYGGSFENRTRFLLETATAMRGAIPEDKPLAVRLSCTDWAEGGWTLDETVQVSRLLKDRGVDLIDCSSGGSSPQAQIPIGPGYQVPLSEQVRAGSAIATAAVGMITHPTHADEIIRNGRADIVFLARELLRDPYWPLKAAVSLNHRDFAQVPVQYERAF